MFFGAVIGAAVSLVPLYMLTHWMKVRMPNAVATFFGCAFIAAIAVLMLVLHFAHTILYGVALAVLGLPLLILTNRFPVKR